MNRQAARRVEVPTAPPRPPRSRNHTLGGVTPIGVRLLVTVAAISFRSAVGVIEGSDPVLKNEYVIVTGHYDHVGQSGPFIYHGADDNASATAVIALAEAFKVSAAPTKRSPMFLPLRRDEPHLSPSAAGCQ